VTLNAYSLGGQELTLELEGLFARAAQHEIDHLDGRLFIDHLTPTGAAEAREFLDEFEREFQSHRERGELPDDDAIAKRLAELEKLRT
jgi:peptide deformylase